MSLSGVPSSLQALNNVQTNIPTSAGAIGMTPAELNDLLTDARNPNIHTRPPPKRPKKIEQVSPYNNAHMNAFLRCYLRSGPEDPIPNYVLYPLLDFCASGDCELVSTIQIQSQKAFIRELEGKPFNTAASGATKSDDPPVTISHIKRSLPAEIRKCATPQMSCSPLHFKFIVDTNGSGVKYFSAQVAIKNEGSSSLAVKLLQRISIVDGQARTPPATGPGGAPQPDTSAPVGQTAGTDFQVFVDKTTVPRKGTSTVLLSLIAQPDAEFGYVHEAVVILVNNVVPLIITFVVVNPSLPLFGTPFPAALTMPVTHSPLGMYHAPVALELLHMLFATQGGMSSKSVLHVLDSTMFAATNKASLLEALDVRSALDELGLLDIVSSGPLHRSSGARGQSTDPTEDRCDSPNRPALPPNTTVATLLPNSREVTFDVPVQVATLNPPATLQLILLWLAEFPTPLVDRSILACDPFVFLETVSPPVQGTLLWCIDFCCTLLLNQRRISSHQRTTSASLEEELAKEAATPATTTGGGANVSTLTAVGGSGSISVRVLAVTFAAVICQSYRPDMSVGNSSLTAADQTVTSGPPEGQTVELIAVQQHLTTAFVHWMCRFIHYYAAAEK